MQTKENTNQQMEEKISVIVAVYNGKNFIGKCIERIAAQTYRNIEIIVVDDGSTDGTRAAAEELEQKYENLRLVCHGENKGLFAARITGVEASTGDYIAFVDADDGISCDWVRLLHDAAKKNSADIAVGRFMTEQGNEYSYFNFDPLRRADFMLREEKPIGAFMKQRGSCYSWWVVWNKLYTRALWECALPDLKEFSAAHPGFTMCEDQAFSIALWLRAEKVCGSDTGAMYYYYKHPEASTAVTVKKSSYESKLAGVAASFDFMRAQLEKFSLAEEYGQDFAAWKRQYVFQYYAPYQSFSSAYKLRTISRYLGMDAAEVLRTDRPNDYFYRVSTKSEKPEFFRLEEIKQKICDPSVKAVSFDVFDTLVLRPFFYATDVFHLISDDFNRAAGSSSYVNFAELRIEAERACREKLHAKRSGEEDITLEDIYACLVSDYGIEPAVAEQTMQAELDAELRFCTARRTAMQLYELARSLGKRVIACSDMYLPERAVEGILRKCGYDFDAVYVSSVRKVAKWTGNLYKYVGKAEKLPASAFVHIGDNYASDVAQARNSGWNAYWLPRCAEMLQNAAPELYGGEAYGRVCAAAGVHDQSSAMQFLGYRCALALAANRLYDDPFADINRESDFNADPYRVGYYALGPYLFAVCEWILQSARQKGAGAVHFVARDGYLPLLAFRIYRACGFDVPDFDYVYLSRRALLFADVQKPVDLHSIYYKINISRQTPQTLAGMFRPFLRREYAEMSDEEMARALGCGGAVYGKNFLSRAEFDSFLQWLGKMVDYEALAAYRQKLKEYFGNIFKPGDLLFDIGYSGRGESALAGLLGFPVNSLYLHTNSDIIEHRKALFGFTTDTFYHYKPFITGVVREHLFMKLAPSAVGYEEGEGGLHPVFEDYTYDFATDWATRTVQNAALDFVQDMLTAYKEYLPRLHARREDLAAALEYYLLYSKDIDRKILSCAAFEDVLGAGEKSFSMYDFWNEEIASRGGVAQVQVPGGRSGRAWRIINRLLPYGSRRREAAKKFYRKWFK